MAARGSLWTIWGLCSLAWLVVGTAFFGAGLGGSDYGAYTSRPSPLLSRTDCNRIADDQGARACIGIAANARARRVMLHEARVQRSVVAGSLIMGPPLAGIFLTWGVGKIMDRRAPKPRRAMLPARQ